MTNVKIPNTILLKKLIQDIQVLTQEPITIDVSLSPDFKDHVLKIQDVFFGSVSVDNIATMRIKYGLSFFKALCYLIDNVFCKNYDIKLKEYRLKGVGL